MRLQLARSGVLATVAVTVVGVTAAGCGSNSTPTAAPAPTPTVTVTAATPKPTPTVTVTSQAPPAVVVPVPGPTVTVPAAVPGPTVTVPFPDYTPYPTSDVWAWEQLVTPVPDGTGRTHISTEPNVTSSVVATVYPGTSVAVVCRVSGYDVDGRSINWDKVTSPAYGWMADMYLQGSPPPDC